MVKSSNRLWRVQGIPLDFDGDGLEYELRNHRELQTSGSCYRNLESSQGYGDENNGATVRTLAVDYRRQYLVATVSFKNLPQRLTCQHNLTVYLERPDESSIVGQKRNRHHEIGIALDDTFEGLTVLFAPAPEIQKLDILAVSGLGSHAFGSFSSKEDGHMWLCDSLPRDFPDARISIYGYNSALRDGNSTADLGILARTLGTVLEGFLNISEAKSLVLIGHSLGGLLIKEALVQFARSNYSSLGDTSLGLLFFGVPNDGMDIESLVPIVGHQPNRVLVESLNRNRSQILRIQSCDFSQVLSKIGTELYCFYETRLSSTAIQGSDGHWKMDGPVQCLVSEASATGCLPQNLRLNQAIPIDRDHSGLVKYRAFDPEYAKVITVLNRLVQNISAVKGICPSSDSSLTMSSGTKRQILSDSELEELLESLNFTQIDAREISIKNAHSKTCRWLLEDPRYIQWLDQGSRHGSIKAESGFLWIKGKPGTGKSTLMKYAFSQVQKQTLRPLLLSFFFNARGDGLEKTTIGMYRSLLVQIFKQRPHLPRILDWRVPKGSHRTIDWTVERLIYLFERAIHSLDEPLVCFIDALDECDERQVRDMVEVFEELCAESTNFAPRICFSSRHYPNITTTHGKELILEGENGHKEDISTYIQTKLHIGKSKIAQVIRQELQEKASGIFMWVVLVVDLLKDKYGRGRLQELRQVLHDLPSDLHELFQNMLLRDTQNHDELLLCMQWVLFAKRPLKPTELYFAMRSSAPLNIADCYWDPEEETHEDIERNIINSSKGLAEVTKSKLPTVQFIHESVRDFLLKEGGFRTLWPALSSNLIGSSHEQLKFCCWNFLKVYGLTLSERQETNPTDDTQTEQESSEKTAPFMEYAVQSILSHAEQSQIHGIDQKTFIESFNLGDWIRLRNKQEKYKIRRYTPHASFLYILAEQNLRSLVRIHPKKLEYKKIEAERYGSPLFAALAMGSDEAVQEFLLCEAEEHEKESHTYHLCLELLRDPSSRKVSFGRDFKYNVQTGSFGPLLQDKNVSWLQLIRRLNMKHFRHPESQYRIPHYWRFSALSRFLLEDDKRFDERNHNGHTALSFAAETGLLGVIRMMLATGKVDVDSKNNDGYTSFSWAAGNGHNEVVEILLATGKVDVDSKNNNGDTPLHMAARNGHNEVVKVLLATGKVDVDSKNNDGYTPLHGAARNGHNEVVEALLATGKVDVDSKSNNGYTSFSWAAGNGHNEVVEILLATGKVDVDSKDNYGDTSLHMAARNGHNEVVEALLATGKVDVDSKNNNGDTPLHMAARNGHNEVVEVLLATGKVDVDSKNNYGYTPLHMAARNGHNKVVEVLLATGKVDVDSKNNYGYTPFSWAARNGHEKVVEILLATGKVDVDSKDNDGYTPLHRAALEGHREVLEILLATGKVDVDSKDNDGFTPSDLAMRSGYSKIAEMISATRKRVLSTIDE